MTVFRCEKCGITQCDSEHGYTSGCQHYPPDNSGLVIMLFGGDGSHDVEGYYWASEGAWYRRGKSRMTSNAVHPIAWRDIERCD